MLATLTDAPFDAPGWVFETKWDGFRLIASIDERRVALYSRSGLIVSKTYKPIAKALEKLKGDAVIDGELVALDANGVSRFQLLQNALRTSANLHYCVFDIMFGDGEDLRDLPLIERKNRLRSILPKDPLLTYSEHWPEHAERSRRRKSAPYRSAMSMLTFYINRAGKNLSQSRLRVLERTKHELRRAFGRA
jgi:bifunctional non-homologous end joining protein LigD